MHQPHVKCISNTLYHCSIFKLHGADIRIGMLAPLFLPIFDISANKNECTEFKTEIFRK